MDETERTLQTRKTFETFPVQVEGNIEMYILAMWLTPQTTVDEVRKTT